MVSESVEGHYKSEPPKRCEISTKSAAVHIELAKRYWESIEKKKLVEDNKS